MMKRRIAIKDESVKTYRLFLRILQYQKDAVGTLCPCKKTTKAKICAKLMHQAAGGKNMKKKLLMTLAMAMVLSNAGYAAVISPKGAGQIGYSATVLCSSLSLHQEPDFNSATVQTLGFGDSIIVMDYENGWAHCTLGDAEDSPKGWVDEDFIAIDPSWYQTEESTPVYAWNDTEAPKVALLDAGTTLPILRDDGDWIVVGLRGASGWICNPDRSTEDTGYAPAGIYAQDSFDAYQNAGEVSGTGQEEAVNPVEVNVTDQEAAADAFPVYETDGAPAVYIFQVAGNTYEDYSGKTYLERDGGFYCITEDQMYWQ